VNPCHICGKPDDTLTEKCKLCCDGVEQEFCRACAHDFQVLRTTKDASARMAHLLALSDRAARPAPLAPLGSCL
jgi:hypothetical protein